jgi:HlyD family secretion protein
MENMRFRLHMSRTEFKRKAKCGFILLLRTLGHISLLGLAILIFTACSTNAEQPIAPATVSDDGDSFSQPLAGNLSANGILHPVSTRTLSFSTGGNVKFLNVEVGVFVQAGEPLAELDDTELQRAVALAEMELNIALEKLDQLKTRVVPLQERVIAATAAISSAQTALTQALTRADLRSNQDVLDRAALSQAELALKDAQNAYDNLLKAAVTRDWAPYSPYAKALEDAKEHYRLTLAEYRLHSADRGYELAIANAKAELARAYLELYEVQHPVSDEALTLALMEVTRAELALTATKEDLTGSMMVAPFDGLISVVHVSEGEWVQPGVPVVELLDVSRWRIETRNVGELEIGRVRVGQKANVRINAFRDEVLVGRVVIISPVAVVQQGDTTYTLIIELEPSALNLRSGMTAQVEVLIEE